MAGQPKTGELVHAGIVLPAQPPGVNAGLTG